MWCSIQTQLKVRPSRRAKKTDKPRGKGKPKQSAGESNQVERARLESCSEQSKKKKSINRPKLFLFEKRAWTSERLSGCRRKSENHWKSIDGLIRGERFLRAARPLKRFLFLANCISVILGKHNRRVRREEILLWLLYFPRLDEEVN